MQRIHFIPLVAHCARLEVHLPADGGTKRRMLRHTANFLDPTLLRSQLATVALRRIVLTQ